MVSVHLLEANPNDMDSSIRKLTEEFIPAFTEHWQNGYEEFFEARPSLFIQLFVNMWVHGDLKLVLAKEGVKTVGFFIAMPFRPMEYEARVLNITDFWCNGDIAVQRALSLYAEDMAKLLACNEVWYDGLAKLPPTFSPQWKLMQPQYIYRLVRR